MNINGLLENQVAIITGAASGIGRASAQLFARQRAKVVVADVTVENGEAVAAGIVAEGGDAIFVRTDVGKMAEVEALVQATLDKYGKLNIIYSNAAAFAAGNAVQLSEPVWDRILNVGLKATYMLAHCGVPHIQAAGCGAIVITASVHSLLGYADYTAYQASKGGLLALTRALAADFAPEIRVNAILPGAVMTGASAHMTEEQRQRSANMCVLKRNGVPEDIAWAALFLASDMSSYMTGTYLVVDGGLSSIIQISPEP